MKELSKKEIKEIIKRLKEEYDIEVPGFITKDFLWFINKDKKVFIIRREAKNFLDIKDVQKFGLYILKLEKDGIRLSIEGSQIFGPLAKKKILNTDKNIWMKTDEIKVNIEYTKGFWIVKDNKDFMGSAKIKNYFAKSYVPKNRRLPA